MGTLNVPNRTLFHGDNLDFLRGMNSGTVNLIATDPPFNKNKDFHATPDSLAKDARFVDRWSWDRDVHEEWVDAIKDDWFGVWQAIENGRVNHSPGMAAFLCWLGIRLIEMRRVLADNGSIYLHIDHTAHAYTKALMDAIFGRRNFQNELVWCYEDVGGRATSYFKHKHDTILAYRKTREPVFNIQRKGLSESTIKRYAKYFDSNGQITYRSLQSSNPGVFRKLKGIPDDLDRVWLDINEGSPLNDWWADISAIKKGFAEASGFPTQKPLALYERIIKASSNPGDMVLDPFCGCATTPVAAERLGRQWIGMDIWDGAIDVVRKRMSDNRQLIADSNPQITYTTIPPERTDDPDDTLAVPDLELRVQRVKEPWERLSHAEMRDILAAAQAQGDNVVCAGCGIALPVRYMQLDHREPRKDGGENVITNRILLCAPCNNTKRASLTLSGLITHNRSAGYMANQDLATLVATKARDAAQRCRTEMR